MTAAAQEHLTSTQKSTASQVDVVMVDWLGRGGIAHMSEAWARELEADGATTVLVLTRAGRELVDMVRCSEVPAVLPGTIISHLALVSLTVRKLAEYRPRWLVVQGSIFPQAELAVMRAAQRRGIRVCYVAHEPHVANPTPGAENALRAWRRRSDLVIAHSQYVAEVVGGTVEVLPLPSPLWVVALRGEGEPALPPPQNDELTALSFGQFNRGHKGFETVNRLAELQPPGWRVAVVGTDLPREASAHLVRQDGFLEASNMVATVTASDSSLMPYPRAAQSGAVTLAQCLGSVVLVSAAGGLPEQVEDQVTGRVLPLGSPAETWAGALAELRDDRLRHAMAEAALRRRAEDHERFARGIRRLLARTASASR